MGKALQVVSGFLTAPSATLQTVTPSGTDTFAVQNYEGASGGYMLDAWADIDTAGRVRFRSPNFHDDVNGINMNVPVTNPTPVLPAFMNQLLQANDVVNAELSDNGAGAPSGLTALWYYGNLPGADANLFSWEAIRPAIVDYMTQPIAVAPAGPAAGQYAGATTMQASGAQFKASTNYALLGYTTSKQYQTVGVTGPDTSNRRIGGPGTTPAVFDTRQWFIDISQRSQMPCIPVFNSQNMAATVVDVIDTQAVGSGSITFFFARLNTPAR